MKLTKGLVALTKKQHHLSSSPRIIDQYIGLPCELKPAWGKCKDQEDSASLAKSQKPNVTIITIGLQ